MLFDCCEANIPPFFLETVLPRLNSVQQVAFTCPKCCVIASPFHLSFCNILPPPSASRSTTHRLPFRDTSSPPSAMHHLLRSVTTKGNPLFSHGHKGQRPIGEEAYKILYPLGACPTPSGCMAIDQSEGVQTHRVLLGKEKGPTPYWEQ